MMRRFVFFVTTDDHVTDTERIAQTVANDLAPAIVTVREFAPSGEPLPDVETSTFVVPEEPS